MPCLSTTSFIAPFLKGSRLSRPHLVCQSALLPSRISGLDGSAESAVSEGLAIRYPTENRLHASTTKSHSSRSKRSKRSIRCPSVEAISYLGVTSDVGGDGHRLRAAAFIFRRVKDEGASVSDRARVGLVPIAGRREGPR